MVKKVRTHTVSTMEDKIRAVKMIHDAIHKGVAISDSAVYKQTNVTRAVARLIEGSFITVNSKTGQLVWNTSNTPAEIVELCWKKHGAAAENGTTHLDIHEGLTKRIDDALLM